MVFNKGGGLVNSKDGSSVLGIFIKSILFYAETLDRLKSLTYLYLTVS
jgi:hypothetical protein